MIIKMLSLNNILVILNILKLKYISYGILYHCENDYNSSLIQKMFNEKQIFVSCQIINLKLDPHFAKSKHGFIVDSDCENWDHVLPNASFKLPNTWIVVGSNLTNTVATLSQYPIEIDSVFNILVKNQYNLHEIFNTGFYTRGKVIVNHLGYIDSKVTNIPRKPRLGAVLGGVTLKCPIVVTDNVVNETYLHFIDRWRPPARDAVHKFKVYRILAYLQTMYGFQYDFVRTKSWGYLRNGSFDGMVGELERGRGDVGGSGVFFRSDRAQFIQYVVEVWRVRPCFIFRHPKYPGGFYTVFTRPLSTTVWASLVLLLVVAAALMAAMLRVSAFDDTSLSLMFVFVSGAVGQQGIPIYSQSSAVKILIFSILIFTLTIYQYYNATVVSTLLREPPTTIRTLEDLLHSKMDIGIEDTLYDRDYFRRTTDPIAIKLYRTKIDTPKHRNIFPAEVGMRLVRAGGFAFHLESVAGYRLMRGGFEEREICEAQEVALYPPQHVGIVVKKGSPYGELFAVGIRKMYESGIMVRLNNAWEESKPACVRTPDTGAISVTIADFSMALVVVGLGMVMAGIALVGEMVVFRLNRR